MKQKSTSKGRSMRQDAAPASSSKPKNAASENASPTQEVDETVDDDDLCPICQLLLYNPVTTTCNHTLCSSYMAHWADVSVTQSLSRVGLDDTYMLLLPNEIETKCPMCRTLTTAQADNTRLAQIQERYPQTYGQRGLEEKQTDQDEATASIETLTLYIGNEHLLVGPESPDNQNKHLWKFFVRASKHDIIEEVVVHLHPTFRTSRLVLRDPPYEIQRLGWGTFTISADIILKAGYSWMSSEAENAPDGRRRGMLSLDWTLDFEGRGSQGRCRLKVKKDDRVRESTRRARTRQRAQNAI